MGLRKVTSLFNLKEIIIHEELNYLHNFIAKVNKLFPFKKESDEPFFLKLFSTERQMTP
jgi:hypothetical protein